MGVELAPVSHRERFASAAGGFAGILAILLISYATVGSYAAALIVASMGASAVLLFAVPHGALSQPWPVFGGHVLSALVGVTCARMVPDQTIAASLAVGLAIGVMYYLRCIHPPGGATALSAVVGGEAVHALGYQYVLTPILLNVLVILLVAILFNNLFPWRRYPASLQKKPAPVTAGSKAGQVPDISHGDFVYALSQIDSFIDISETDLLTIYEYATRRAQMTVLDPETVVVGNFFSNGMPGKEWSVRQIVDASEGRTPEHDIVIYKVVAGRNRQETGYCTRDEFLHWAAQRLIRRGDGWLRIDPPE